jgi:phage terminase large subunit-like protein
LRSGLIHSLRHQAEAVETFLNGLSAKEVKALAHDWEIWARPDQLPPVSAQGGCPWLVWLMLGGRGAGKTRAGAEWVRGLALGRRPFAAEPVERIALVGETIMDARNTMIEGVSGLLAVHPKDERPTWSPSRRLLTWPNGAVAQIFSAEDPESLRGPQFGAAWADELAKWRYADATWDMLQFGLRLGNWPRQMVTTTPRATPLIKRLLNDPRTALTRAATQANAANLAPGFLDTVLARYNGTRLGRQEIDGEIVEDREDTLWPRLLIDSARVDTAPELTRIVVAVDPPAGGVKSDACGIVAAGKGADGTIYVLEDASLHAAQPHLWAAKAIALWHRRKADALVAEANQGGDMVRAVLREADAAVPVTLVHATRGKWLRAEPVAHLYAQGRIKHVGVLPKLEDEMADFGLNGLSNGHSPDRLDALVWAVTALMKAGQGPKVRGL